jgi:hypothetical protein
MLTGAWKELAMGLDPSQFTKKMKSRIAYANRLNAAIMQRKIRGVIKSNVPPPNAPLTIIVKGSSKTLVDHGALFQGIAAQTVDQMNTFVGVVSTSDVYNLAVALHEGATIKVTDKMRNLFSMLWAVSVGAAPASKLTGRALELWNRMPGGWHRLKTTTTVIHIPPRPFIRTAFEDSATKAKIVSNWEDAVQSALKVQS